MRPSLNSMNTPSSILKYRVGAIAFLGVALMTSAWAWPSTKNTSSSNKTIPEAQARREIAMVYPYEMLIQGKSGWAETSFVIDYAGRPLFTNPLAASDPVFAKAAIAMVEANEYSPVKKDQHATMAQSSQRIEFKGEAALDAEARRVLAELRKPLPSFCSVGDLDERPKAVRQVAPVYPRAMKDDGFTGQAEVEFVVTAEGKVLFPRVISATQEDFGWAAAAAVAQWRFQPPTRNGQKVDARMTVPVLFDARQLAAAD